MFSMRQTARRWFALACTAADATVGRDGRPRGVPAGHDAAGRRLTRDVRQQPIPPRRIA
jgi:hypothetical protein